MDPMTHPAAGPDDAALEREIAIAATVEAVLERLERRGKRRWPPAVAAWTSVVLVLLITAAGWLVGLGELHRSVEVVQQTQAEQGEAVKELTIAVQNLTRAVAVLQDRSERDGIGRTP